MLTVTRFDNLKRFVSSVVVSDPAEIEYIDNDCVGDFQRGLWDDACDRILPGSQLTIRTACGKLVVKREA